MKVELLNKDEVKDLFTHWGNFAKVCYDTKTNAPEKIGKHCFNSGHFSGSRSRYFEFLITDVPRFCYDSETEIMTSEGWKFFKDLKDDEVVATLNSNTKQVEFHKINEKIEFHYDGTMYDISNRLVNLSVTEGHNLFIKKLEHSKYPHIKHDYELVPCNDKLLATFQMYKEFNYINLKSIDKNIIINGFEYEKKTNNGGTTIMRTKDLILDRENFYKFLAWYISDGNVRYDKKEHKYVINITQTKCKKNIENHTIEDIIAIIKNMGLTPVPYDNGIYITNLTLGKYLHQLGKAGDKYIPLDLFNDFNIDLAKVFLSEYFRGDGHIDKNNCGKFYTGSKKLADQLQILSFIAGWTAMIYERSKDMIGKDVIICGKKVKVNLHSYVVNVTFSSNNRKPTIRKKQINKRAVSETVYCVNVPNHIVFVRKNGKVVWCGNCIDQAVRSEIGVVKNVQSFRYVGKNSFSYAIPKEILDNDELVKDYHNHMKQTLDLYESIQNHVYEKTGSKERGNEQARYVIPMATHSAFVIGFTLEALIHYCNVRLCTRTEDVHRKMAHMIKDAVLAELPELKDELVPHCKKLMYCPETHCCGAAPTKTELMEKLKNV